MRQNDIFQLLLIILLISNGHDNDCDDDCGPFGNINSIIIVVLLLTAGGLFGEGRHDRRRDCGCGDNCRCRDERLTEPFVQ